jgi:DNA-binding response OmpR family regulator
VAPHVLLIEDEPNIAEAIRFLLSRDGLRVSHAAEGRLRRWASCCGRIRRIW